MNVVREFIVQAEQESKDSTRVIAMFDRMLRQDPDDDQVPMLYAQYLLSKGMEKESIPVLKQVLPNRPY